MSGISASEVMALRAETGLPMMECKAALAEANGDKAQALELLAKKHKGKMEARSDRETGEGRIAIYIDDSGKVGAMVELRCETAPVAKTDDFIALTDKLAKQVASQTEASPSAEALQQAESVTDPGKTISDLMTGVYGKLRETMKIGACRRMTGGFLTGYVHHDGKSGVLIALDAKPTSPEVGIDLCHHTVFAKPLSIDRSGIPADQIEKVRAQAKEIAEAEGKPAQIVDKIVEGKVNAYCAENALMEQEHVKVTKTKVGDVLNKAGVKTVQDMVVFRVTA